MIAFRLLLACLWGLALVAAAVLSWAGLVATREPERVLAVFPWHEAALEQSLRMDIDRQIGAGTFEDSKLAAALVQADPLADWPFVQRGLVAASEGEGDRALELMLAAYKRDPRNLFTIGWLAQQAAEEGDGASALSWLDRLVAVNPRLGGDMRTVALSFTQEEGGLAELARLLGSGRSWAGAVVGELNRSSENLSALLELNRLAPKQQDGFLERLLKERGPEVAFIAWLSLLDNVGPGQISWPFDPDFQGIDAPRPFNWSLNRDLAEMNPEDGLYTVYFGRERPRFARQVMMLRPGTYELATEFSGETRETAGRLVWEVSCLNARTPLASLTLENPGGLPSTATVRFEVPRTDCTAQQLILKGVPGDFPARIRIATRSIRIDQVRS